jgi:hypothetical protein
MIKACRKQALRLRHESVSGEVTVLRGFVAFASVKEANKTLLEGLVHRSLVAEVGVEARAAIVALNLQHAIAKSAAAQSRGSTATVLVCDVVYARPYPLVADMPALPQSLFPAGYDCALRVVEAADSQQRRASASVGEVLVTNPAMILPRALFSLDTGSLV